MMVNKEHPAYPGVVHVASMLEEHLKPIVGSSCKVEVYFLEHMDVQYKATLGDYWCLSRSYNIFEVLDLRVASVEISLHLSRMKLSV